MPFTDFNPRAPYGARRRCRPCRQTRTPYFNPRAPYGARPRPGGCPSRHPYFNPRAPYGARRKMPGSGLKPSLHFNPRAPYGARPSPVPSTTKKSHFNPRAPYGARQQKCIKIACVFAITDKGQMLFPPSSAVCQDARSGSRRKPQRPPVRTVPKIPYACSSHYRIIGSSGRYVCLQPKCSILLSYFFPR